MKLLIVALLSFYSSSAHAQSLSPKGHIHIYTSDTPDFLTGEIRDDKNIIEGRFYEIQRQLYGGSARIGRNFYFEGLVGYQRRSQLFVLDHSQEVSILKRRVGNVSIEPTIQQVTQAEWAQDQNSLKVLGVMTQPASLGVFVQTRSAKGRYLRAGVTSGPAWVIKESPFAKNQSTIVGRVNLRLTLTF